MKKVAIFAFEGEFMCFIHVLLNAVDMHERGYDVKVIIEGAATKLIPELASGDSPMSKQYENIKGLGLIAGACKACSAKAGVLDAVKAEGLALLDEMKGHPSMAGWMEQGYEVMLFG